MSYVKLNVYYFGKKHINSGTYVITQQVDDVSFGGFKTTLSLVRIAGDEDTNGLGSYSAEQAAAEQKHSERGEASKNEIKWTPPHTGVDR